MGDNWYKKNSQQQLDRMKRLEFVGKETQRSSEKLGRRACDVRLIIGV